VLDDRQPEAGTAGGPRPVGPEEALEEAAELGLGDADAVVGAAQDDPLWRSLDGERELGPRARVADRILGQVERQHTEHPRPQRKLDLRVALDRERDPGPCRPLEQVDDDRLQLRHDRHGRERDDTRARLQLREEEHFVDQLPNLLDLPAGLLDQRTDVLARQAGGLQDRKQPGERRPQLVRDGRSESGAQLLVGGEVSLSAQIDETLPPAVGVVGHDKGDETTLAGEQAAGQRLALDNTLDRLARPAAGGEDDIALVEHDDGFATLLDERPAPHGVGVDHGVVLTEPLRVPCLDDTETSRERRTVAFRPHEKEEAVKATGRATLTAIAALAFAATASAAVIVGTNGDDRLVGTAGADHIRALAGDDHIRGRDGNDTLGAGAGNDATDAGPGNDEVLGGGGSDRLSGGAGSDRLEGGSGDDRLNAGAGDDRAAGGPGDDAVAGGGGSDSLYGGWGSDRSSGGAGNDRLHALAADGQVDVLDCGPGRDTAIIRRSERGLTRIVDCEVVVTVVVGSAEDEAAENADTDGASD
jgi:RTX calcium-binding nonapeptide repeat (4 copies)